MGLKSTHVILIPLMPNGLCPHLILCGVGEAKDVLDAPWLAVFSLPTCLSTSEVNWDGQGLEVTWGMEVRTSTRIDSKKVGK